MSATTHQQHLDRAASVTATPLVLFAARLANWLRDPSGRKEIARLEAEAGRWAQGVALLEERLSNVKEMVREIQDEHHGRANASHCNEDSCRECNIIERIGLAIAWPDVNLEGGDVTDVQSQHLL